MNKEKLKIQLSYFNREATVEHEGKSYQFTESDFKQLNSRSNYWHHKKGPSSWLSEATVSLGKRKFKGKMPRAKIIELCALTLNVSSSKLESSLDWNANYMAYRDGRSADYYHPYPEEES